MMMMMAGHDDADGDADGDDDGHDLHQDDDHNDERDAKHAAVNENDNGSPCRLRI